jgi:hypothetical protein
MSARILFLPKTAAGRALLRGCLPYARNGQLPDGLSLYETDFDAYAAEFERLIASIPNAEAL